MGRIRNPRTAATLPLVGKLLAYAGVSLGLLLALVLFIGNMRVGGDRTEYTAVLPDATGLFVNDSVRAAGVNVGRVTDIAVERGRAVVTFRVDADVALPADTEVGVRWRNVIGQKYLYLYPGTAPTALSPGDRIELERSRTSVQVGDFLQAVGPVLRALDPADANAIVRSFSEAVEGNEEVVRGLLGDAAEIGTALGDLDGEIASGISNLDLLVTAVAQEDQALDAMIVDLQTTMDTLADNDRVLIELVTDFRTLLDELERFTVANDDDIDGIVDALVVVSTALADHADDLAASLASLPEGLMSYHDVSASGQWFILNNVVLCQANQTRCDYQDPEGGSSSTAAATSGLLSSALGAGGTR